MPDVETGDDRMLVGDKQDQQRRTGKSALEDRGRKGVFHSVMKNKADAHPDEDGKQDDIRKITEIPHRPRQIAYEKKLQEERQESEQKQLQPGVRQSGKRRGLPSLPLKTDGRG